MSPLRIALLQMTAHGNDQDANLIKGEEFCRRARDMGADVALFPEMWNIGYTSYCEPHPGPSDLWRAPERWNDDEPAPDASLEQAREQWQAQAIGRDDPFVTHFCRLARELEMAIALTYLERWAGAPRNSVSLVDRHGEITMTYAKVHTCDFDYPESACTPGDDFHVCTLDTAQGEAEIGAMICYDREFPESARVLIWSFLGPEGRNVNKVLAGIEPDDVWAMLQAWEEHLQAQLKFPFKARVFEHQGYGLLRVGDCVQVLRISSVDESYGVIVDVRVGRAKYAFPLTDLEVLNK
ncbi:MAG: hypothetical protein MAG451_01776 [Anaerolineales bacterium]|nr:hypothetical protein [Anaerolineales bacterium]